MNNENFSILVDRIKTGKMDLDNFLVSGVKITSAEFVKLVKATGEIEKYLTPENITAFGVWRQDVVELIKATGNINKYLFPWQQQEIDKAETEEEKECIYEIMFSNYQSEYQIGLENIIYATGKIEKYLTPENVKKYHLKSRNIAKLIKATGVIDKYLLPWQKQKADKAKTEEEKQRIYDRILSENQIGITNLIYATGDVEKYLTPENMRIWSLSPDECVDLIKDTGNINKYLFPWQQQEIGEAETDEEKELMFSNYQIGIANLIYATGEIEKYLTSENIQLFGLTTDDVVKLIRYTEDIEKYLTSKNVQIWNFSVHDIAELVKATGNINKYLLPWQQQKIDEAETEEEKKCIYDRMLREGQISAVNIIYATEDTEKSQRLMETIDGKRKKINLPKEMTIGIEIESEGIKSRSVRGIPWKSKNDDSLINGIEVVSPILTSDEQSAKDIYLHCGYLQYIGNIASERCGGHIHIGANYLQTKQSYVNLLAIYGNTENLLYTICNDPADISSRNTRFSHLMSKKIVEAIDNGTINLETEEDVEDFIDELKLIQRKRFSGINFLSYDCYQTIEFRLPNGTINPDAWIENINLFGGIVKSAEEIRIIQEKSPEKRKEEENEKLKIFLQIQSGELNDIEKLEALLELVITEEEKDVYRNRYKQNIQLLSEAQKNEYKKQSADKPIKSKDAGESAFSK